MAAGAGWSGGAARAALWLLLGGWFGAWCLFAFAVAPVTFRTLTPEVAGSIVGPVLTVLHLYGAAAGVVLFLLARALGRGFWHQTVPLAMAALCLFSQFWVTAEIARVRDLAFGPAGSAEALARFGHLHAVSMGIYTAVGILALALIGLHAGADARGGEAPRPPPAPSNGAKNRGESPENA